MPTKKPRRKATATPAPAHTSGSARTLSAFIIAARQERELSQRALGRAAGLDQSIVHKIEAGNQTSRGRVRAESLSAVLHALGWREGHPEYARAFALWTAEQHERTNLAGRMSGEIIEARFDAATSSRDAEHERLRRACEEALDHLPHELWPEMLSALKNHRALKLWLESANALRH